MMNDAVQSRRPSGTRGENGFDKALGEYSSLAVFDAAKEAPCDYTQRYPATGARQIRRLPFIGYARVAKSLRKKDTRPSPPQTAPSL
jgi:hypothetical protein